MRIICTYKDLGVLYLFVFNLALFLPVSSPRGSGGKQGESSKKGGGRREREIWNKFSHIGRVIHNGLVRFLVYYGLNTILEIPVYSPTQINYIKISQSDFGLFMYSFFLQKTCSEFLTIVSNVLLEHQATIIKILVCFVANSKYHWFQLLLWK